MTGPPESRHAGGRTGSMRDELLNGETFRTVTVTRVVVESWPDQYNQIRPHRGLGMKTPAAFAAYAESDNDATYREGSVRVTTNALAGPVPRYDRRIERVRNSHNRRNKLNRPGESGDFACCQGEVGDPVRRKSARCSSAAVDDQRPIFRLRRSGRYSHR
ncbi:MAG: integrase catalytic subunit [Aeromicrobium sp.]|nr:integrase catalytic subunit [Aeromicrobium sp.]